jgi:hypothetical protein
VFAIPSLYHTSTTLSNTENPAATPPSLPSVPLVLQADTLLAPPRLPPQIVHMRPKMPSSGRLLKSPRFCHFTRRGPHGQGTRLPHAEYRSSPLRFTPRALPHVDCRGMRRSSMPGRVSASWTFLLPVRCKGSDGHSMARLPSRRKWAS